MHQRLTHIDVFKGILIIMVVMGHIVYMVSKATGTSLEASPYYWTQYISSVWIAPYYMAAFFLASGYCSSFKRSLKEQITLDVRRLVIPSITIPILMRIVTPPLRDINLEMFAFIIQGQLPWFLMAMFFARFVYKLTKLIDTRDVYRTLLLIFLSIFACWTLKNRPSWEYMSFIHSLAFAVFIDLGYKLKQIKIKKYYAIIAAVIYVLMVSLYPNEMPTLCSTIGFEAKCWPFYFVAVICGSLVVYQISKAISHNAILEYLGRNSLVIYLTHIEFIRFMSAYMIRPITEHNKSTLFSLAVIIFMLVGGTCWGAIWAWVLNRKYARWIIGG